MKAIKAGSSIKWAFLAQETDIDLTAPETEIVARIDPPGAAPEAVAAIEVLSAQAFVARVPYQQTALWPEGRAGLEIEITTSTDERLVFPTFFFGIEQALGASQ